MDFEESDMTSMELKRIFDEDESFKEELQELSGYLASIKQERPIIFSLAKCFWKTRKVFELEEKRRDLVVDGNHIEFKYSYDCDMEKVKLEMEIYEDKPPQAMWDDIKCGKLKEGWSQCVPICKDMFGKMPHSFVWVIHSRDLTGVQPTDLERINWYDEQLEWNETHPYPDLTLLAIADEFLIKMQDANVRPFSVLTAKMTVNADFPSIYNFRICDFTTTAPASFRVNNGRDTE
jgi:hypothetical protein